MSTKILKPVVAQPGRPLYLTVKEHVREAIDSGVFRPGEQMPSTKQLSEKLEVSLVTAHRALQELVNNGVLYRAQGKGTFVHDRYLDRTRRTTAYRIGILLNHDLAIGDELHGPIIDGVRNAAHQLGAELLLLRGPDDIRRECSGFLAIDPVGAEAAEFAGRLTRRQPLITVGSMPVTNNGACVRVDAADMAVRALEYLRGQGHERIGYVGGPESMAIQAERWAGFETACNESGLQIDPAICARSIHALGGEKETSAIVRMFTGPKRPTAVLAASSRLALQVYLSASVAGLRIPEDLSVIGLNDPPCAPFLAPALTVVREPLGVMGQAAITMLCEHLQHPGTELVSRELRGELILRRSCATLRK